MRILKSIFGKRSSSIEDSQTYRLDDTYRILIKGDKSPYVDIKADSRKEAIEKVKGMGKKLI